MFDAAKRTSFFQQRVNYTEKSVYAFGSCHDWRNCEGVTGRGAVHVSVGLSHVDIGTCCWQKHQ
jgi:hypothetical protein